MRFYVHACAVCVLLLLGGCATYHALPLPHQPNLDSSFAAGTQPAPAATSLPRILDLDNVGLLARRRDPNLAAARARVRVAQARAYAAGLLPDPTLGFSFDKRMNGPDPFNGKTLSIATTLVGWITHGERQRAGRAEYAAAILGWRWKAEQAALKAETTWLKAWAAGREVAALHRETKSAQALLAAARKAHAAGALAQVMYQQALVQVTTLRTRLQTAADNRVKAETSLATLLRVQAGRPWRFSAPVAFSVPAPATVTAALAQLPKRRLDLLALQAGYRSTDAKLRASILAQFPLLNIGFNRARDTAGNNTFGTSISLRLPFFNGNRGKIAINRATRKQLNAAYQAHLDTATNQARAVYARLRLAQRELVKLEAQLPLLKRSARASRKALARQNVTRFAAYTALSAWLDASIDAHRLRANATQLALTLRTLLAMPPAQSTIANGTST